MFAPTQEHRNDESVISLRSKTLKGPVVSVLSCNMILSDDLNVLPYSVITTQHTH